MPTLFATGMLISSGRIKGLTMESHVGRPAMGCMLFVTEMGRSKTV
jgi:hypothetical protein